MGNHIGQAAAQAREGGVRGQQVHAHGFAQCGVVGRVDQGADREADLGHGVRVSVKILSVDEASSAAAVSIWRDGVRLSGTTVVRPYDRAAVISAGREGDAVLVVPITVRR